MLLTQGVARLYCLSRLQNYAKDNHMFLYDVSCKSYKYSTLNLHWLQVVLMRASQCLLFRNNFLEFGIKMCATVASFLGHSVVVTFIDSPK